MKGSDAAALERAHAVHAGRVLGRGRMSGGDEGGAGKRAGCAAEISAIGHVAFSLFTVGRSVNACCPEGCSEVDGGDVLHGLGAH